ncbi:MAG: GHKL domain-containing protein [Candidatus Nitrosotenuis sp.]|nr:MAG: GHKL domain-containing protein [Candidatus Nitrosotenuis sp.]
MSGINPYFFIKEVPNEEIVRLLAQKIKELKSEKDTTAALNLQLINTVNELKNTHAELLRNREVLEEQVKQKTEELLNLERVSMLGNFTARAAHDLKNPLSVIKNTSQILRITLDKYLDEKSNGQWSRLDRAVARMSHQIDDVLGFVKPPKLERKKHIVANILSDVLERMEIPNNINIHPPLVGSSIYCDAEKIEIVFVNLLTNAIQAIGENEGSIDISISENSDPKYLEIHVQDSGCGIPQNLSEKLFEPFFTTKQTGTGLGLVSCKSIVEEHGGHIGITSTFGKGTTIKLRLPKESEFATLQTDSQERALEHREFCRPLKPQL